MTSGEMFEGLLDDLHDEAVSLLRLVAGLGPDGWRAPTPAPGWEVRDQIGHLCYFDEQATLSATDADRFQQAAQILLEGGPHFTDALAHELRAVPPAELLVRWVDARAEMVEAFRRIGPAARTPWYGPTMSVMSAATARLMETWAHGVDVADALGAPLEVTSRLRHVADIGYRTFRFSFVHHGEAEPERAVRVAITGPQGVEWRFGPDDATDQVKGAALDFALVVTQRRSVEDTSLTVEGPVATRWMQVAQAFAGRPTTRAGTLARAGSRRPPDPSAQLGDQSRK
ncbi:MAG TPA: TIGR03084 family metal-binding protein [Acidimicrobiales bacterium]|jgi:uncharacterized protein (TIGR03084 family)|nr:TIGR03084 family metal-binding protein [Acidimicrobiales bacterium]